MKVSISGAGVWGPGFCSIEEFRQVLLDAPAEPGDTVAPKPELIPARERRRSPLMVKLAIEVAAQACDRAGVDPAAAQCVFSSGIGDADLTDYMCRVLAGPDKLLSPTKFHNSVHNAAVGFWSISTGCEQAATFVSSLHNSFPTALMESMVQATTDQVPVLLVLSDLPIPGPMKNMHPIDQLFGAALLLAPEGHACQAAGQNNSPLLALELEQGSADWPDFGVPGLQLLYAASPAARSLCLLEALCSGQSTEMKLPLSDTLSAAFKLQASSQSI